MTDVWNEEGGLRRRQLVFDLLLAGAFGLVLIPAHLTQSRSAGLAAALVALALAFRRISWPAMVLFGLLGAVLQVVTTEVAYVADAAYAAMFFALGSHRDPRVRQWGLVAAAVATVVGAVALFFGQAKGLSRSPFEMVLATVAVTATTAIFTIGGWVAGFVRWQNRRAVQDRVDAQVEAVERRRLLALYDQEQERRRIAADMHDVVAHSWAVVAAQADGARYALRTSPDDADRALGVIGDTARTAIGDLRTLVAQLRDPDVQPTTPGYAQQAELFERMRASGMQLQLNEIGERSDSPLRALTAHRLLGESLTNALKHGDLSAPVVVDQDWRDGYGLTVTNAVPTERPAATKALGVGHGIVGMTERAVVAGGTLTSRREGDLWVVHVRLPRDPDAEPNTGADTPTQTPETREVSR